MNESTKLSIIEAIETRERKRKYIARNERAISLAMLGDKLYSYNYEDGTDSTQDNIKIWQDGIDEYYNEISKINESIEKLRNE